jgi:AcrR family transcriptional regulator
MTERGSTTVSLSDIALRSGLNSALVKYYFDNKAGLFMAMLRRVLEPALRQMEQLLEMPISPVEKMRLHIRGHVSTYYRHPYINRIIHQLLAEDPEVFGPLIAEEFSRPIAEAQRRILEEGFTEGHFRNINPAMFNIQVNGACDNLFFARFELDRIHRLKNVDDRVWREFADHLWDSLFQGIRAGPKIGDRDPAP